MVESNTEVIDIEEFAIAGRAPPPGQRYRIRIDRERFVVYVPSMTGRGLLELAGKSPPERWMISQKTRDGGIVRIGLDDKVDFTKPGIERFVTLPLDQTEG